MFVGGMCMYRHARIYPYIHTYLYIPLSPLTIPVQELSSLALSSMNFPFRSKVVGIENFVPEAFPRLAASDEITMVSLRSFIFHGASKVGGSVDRSKTHRMRCVLVCFVVLSFVEFGLFVFYLSKCRSARPNVCLACQSCLSVATLVG